LWYCHEETIPKADGGEWSQVLGEAEKWGTSELVAGKNTGYCSGEKLPSVFLYSGPCLGWRTERWLCMKMNRKQLHF